MNNIITRLCAIVIATHLEELTTSLQKASPNADLVELRLDFIPNIKPSDLNQIRDLCKLPTIITCRAKAHGGQFTGSIQQQFEILQQDNALGFEFIDIDLSIAKDIVFDKQHSKRILSFHNFEKTPNLATLESIKKEMHDNQADIMKFATYANSMADSKTLLKFLLNKAPEEKMIVLGMGNAGRMTRILSPLLGGYLTFINAHNPEAAVGSISGTALNEIFDKVKYFIENKD